jgi:hypothetical protein
MAGESRQPEVQDHRSGTRGVKSVEAGLTVSLHVNGIVLGLKKAPQGFLYYQVIFDH